MKREPSLRQTEHLTMHEELRLHSKRMLERQEICWTRSNLYTVLFVAGTLYIPPNQLLIHFGIWLDSEDGICIFPVFDYSLEDFQQ